MPLVRRASSPVRGAVLGIVLVAMVAAGCSSSSSSTTTGTSTTTTTVKDTLTGSLTVFAASSLTEAFGAERSAFIHLHPNLDVTLLFEGSNAVVQHVQAGAQADVVATADAESLAPLVSSRLVSKPVPFATNLLEILVPPRNPARIAGLADLAKPGVKVALCSPQVPCGDFASQVLRTAHVTVTPVTLEADVKGVVTKVTTGEVDAGIVYASDAKAAAGTATGVPVPRADNVVATYPAAVVTASPNPAAAQAFVAFLGSAVAQRILVASGFGVP